MNEKTAPRYRVGAARIPFNPPVGLPMAGYAARTGSAQGTYDTLYVRAVTVTDGDEHTLCLLAADVLHLDTLLVAEIRSDIAARLSVNPMAIMVAATHTHSGPAGLARILLGPGSERYLGVYNPSLAQQLRACCAEAAEAAYMARVQAQAVIGRGSASGVAGNRLNPQGTLDPHVPWIAFVDDTGNIRVCIFSLPCHPTVLSSNNRLYSADLAGALCRRLEHDQGVEYAVCLIGAAGNISTRFTRCETSFTEVERLAAQVSQTFNFDSAPIDSQLGCAAASTELTLALKLRDFDSLRRRLIEVEHLLSASADSSQRATLSAEKLGLELALTTASAEAEASTVTAEVQILRIGVSLIACFPGEIFVEYGLALRDRLPDAHILIAGYANGYIGYVPTPEVSSGYEATMAIVAPEAGGHLVEAILQLAQSVAHGSTALASGML